MGIIVNALISLSERLVQVCYSARSWALPHACGVASSGPAEEEITAPLGIRRASSHDGRVVAIVVRNYRAERGGVRVHGVPLQVVTLYQSMVSRPGVELGRESARPHSRSGVSGCSVLGNNLPAPLNVVGGRAHRGVYAGWPVAHDRAHNCQCPLLVRSVVGNVHLWTIYKV